MDSIKKNVDAIKKNVDAINEILNSKYMFLQENNFTKFFENQNNLKNWKTFCEIFSTKSDCFTSNSCHYVQLEKIEDFIDFISSVISLYEEVKEKYESYLKFYVNC